MRGSVSVCLHPGFARTSLETGGSAPHFLFTWISRGAERLQNFKVYEESIVYYHVIVRSRDVELHGRNRQD